MTASDLRPPRRGSGLLMPPPAVRVAGQGADVPVTQPVEDQLGQLAGGGDDADVAAAAGGDPVPDLPDAGVRG